MSVAEQTTLTSKSPRRNPAAIRVAPKVLHDFSVQPGTEKAGEEGACGFLFGTVEQEIVKVEALKVFPTENSDNSASSHREFLEAAFESSIEEAGKDSELRSLHLIGWYRVQSPNDFAPMSESDIEFHNRHFRRATDLALILKPKQHGAAATKLLEFYTRSSSKSLLSTQDHCSGSLLLAGVEAISSPSEVTMREGLDDDYYLRVFQVLDSLDRAEKDDGWKRIALRLKAITPPSLRPEWMRSQNVADARTTDPETSVLPQRAPARETALGGDSAGPHAPSPFSTSRVTQTKLRWISAVTLMLLVTGAALAWLYASPRVSTLLNKTLFHRSPRSTAVNLRVEPQAGGALLVKWDAHSSPMQSASKGTVQIDDGSEHRDLHLDSIELANGSILYTPLSSDLTFRLEVVGRNGAPISESMRVVNGSRSAWMAHSIPNARPRKLTATMPASTGKTALRQPVTVRDTKPTPLVATEKGPSDVKIRPDRATTTSPAPTNPAATSSSAPMPDSKRSGTMASNVMHPPTRNGLEGQRKAPDSDKADVRGNSHDLPPKQFRANSPQPAVTNDFASTKYAPPRPLKQVMPSTINLASTVLSRATDIEVQVRIDDEGRVTEAAVVNNGSNNGLLTSAALEAAKGWIFEPAKLHGKSIPSYHAIKFRFHPQVEQQ